MPVKGEELTELSNGEIRLWAEHGTSIHLKAVTAYGDPVELSEDEATELAQHLLDQVMLLENKGNDSQPNVHLMLTSDEALVLFALLSDYDDTKELKLTHRSEQRALWNLQCLLEKCLVEPFRDDYETLLAKARLALTDEIADETFDQTNSA